MQQTKLDIRGLKYHVQEWGDPAKPRLIFLHGWMDCGATFKFVVEHLIDHYHIVAPDLRGYGQTEHASSYWFPDYFADLAEILDHYSARDPARIVGHSMGGNIAMIYAGLHPHRVSSLLSLEGFGLAPTEPADAPDKYRRWMYEILSDEPSKVYPNVDALRYSIYKGNPRLSAEMIEELVALWGEPYGDGQAMQLKHDHKHRYANPIRYNFEDIAEVWKCVTAKVGLVIAQESDIYRRFKQAGRIEQIVDLLNVDERDVFTVPDAGHMLHLEQPKATAESILAFLA